MEVKPGYKLTEVGVIPEDWEAKKLSEVTSLQVGYAFKSAWFTRSDGIPLLRGENVGYRRTDWTDTRMIPVKLSRSFAEYHCCPAKLLRSGINVFESGEYAG